MNALTASIERALPQLALAIFVVAVSIGTFAGGLWGGLGIGGGILAFAGTWIVDGKRPNLDLWLVLLFGCAIDLIAALNLRTAYPAEGWMIWFRVVTILVPLCLWFSPEVQTRINHKNLFPITIVAAFIGAYALGLELIFSAPVLYMVKGPHAYLTEYNRGISYLVIFAFPLLAYLWAVGRRWEMAAFILVLLLPSSFTESRATRMALIFGVLTTASAMLMPVLTRYALTAVLIVLLAFPVPFAFFNFFPDHPVLLKHMAPSWVNRMEIWDFVSYRIFEKPWLGWGMGSTHLIPYFQPHGNLYHYVDSPAPHPHNVILQLWVELGLPGLALGVLFALMLLRRASRLPAELVPFAYGSWMAGLCISLVAYNFWSDSLFALFALTGLAFILLAQEIKRDGATVAETKV